MVNGKVREIFTELAGQRVAALEGSTQFPDRFSANEIRERVLSFLVHAPNHVAAAAKLGGWPVKDIFGVGALSGGD
jgi:hypothetical protein